MAELGDRSRRVRSDRSRATMWSPIRSRARPGGSRSTRPRSRSGRGWSRWASAGPAGTATTGSTSAARAPTASSRRGSRSRSATSCRRIPAAASRWSRSNPHRSIVLRSDTALVKAQADAWAKQRGARTDATEAAAEAAATSTAGLAASGAILGQTPQQFSASWAFVIEPMSGGRSRLIERFRVWYGESGMASHVVMPVVGFGVFVMMQRQMVGIRTRAERLAVARTRSTTPPAPTPADAGEPRASAEPTPPSQERPRQGDGRPGARDGDRRLTRPRKPGARPTAVGCRRLSES